MTSGALVSTLPAPDDAMGRASALCEATLARGSKSFALAGRLLAPRARTRAAVLYTFCRNVDDAIDLCPRAEQPVALDALEQRVRSVYAGEAQHDLAFEAFAELVRAVHLPASYPQELLSGMRMDVVNTRYDTVDDLLLYCHRVAGVVGLMMCHVLGIERDSALRQAAHLGIAMQLTNICRDVAEDWQLGRIYLPRTLLAHAGLTELELQPDAQNALDPRWREPLAVVVEKMLRLADGFYRSADAGLSALPWRAALAIRAARHVYANIGTTLAARRHDVLAGRAVVPAARKLWLVARSGVAAVGELPWRAVPRRHEVPGMVLSFPEDVLPLPDWRAS